MILSDHGYYSIMKSFLGDFDGGNAEYLVIRDTGVSEIVDNMSFLTHVSLEHKPIYKNDMKKHRYHISFSKFYMKSNKEIEKFSKNNLPNSR